MKSISGGHGKAIPLKGVWRDYHDIIVKADEKQRLSDEMTGFAAEDRDSMAFERLSLLAVWRDNVSSLTRVVTSNLRAQQIVDQVRIEKENLEAEFRSLEAQRDLLSEEVKNLKMQLALRAQSLDDTVGNLKNIESSLRIEKHKNNTLRKISERSNATIEVLNERLYKQEINFEILKKSISTKDSQIQTLSKERNRQKEDLQRTVKYLATTKRFLKGSQPSENAAPGNAGGLYPPSGFEIECFGRLPCPQSTPSAEYNSEAITQQSNSGTSKEIYLSDHSQRVSVLNEVVVFTSPTPALHDHCNLVCEESTVDMKDKIYRSIIKKLRNQLAVAESKLNASASSSRMRF
jgi:predicted site-specific integrase-resolvase